MKRVTLYRIAFLLLALAILMGANTRPTHGKEPENIVTALYISSDGTQLTARFDIKGRKVMVRPPEGKELTLPEAVSASGARYSDGKMTFWEHQGSATLFKGDGVVFKGKEAPGGGNERAVGETALLASCRPVADSALCDGIARYASLLKETDKDFGDPPPAEPFECLLNAGKGREPVNAPCAKVVKKVMVKGGYASVLFVLAPVEKKYGKMTVMADGALYFFMKKDKGAWRGIDWFLGSDKPEVKKKKVKEHAIPANVLTALGWNVGEE
ncbi:MAG TPA: MliC family protein [Syntrophorhabdaceae bacterium]|jgi:membrane-bound inhibitor of C-type lysozyme